MVISEDILAGAVDTGVVVNAGEEGAGAGGGGAGANRCELDTGTAGRIGVKFEVGDDTLALAAGSFLTPKKAPG